MGDVIPFTGITYGDEPPDYILEKAKTWGDGLERVLILGICQDGKFHFGGSTCDVGKMLVLLKLAERELMNGAADATGIG